MDCFGTGHILITRVLLDPSINKSKKEGRAIERADELKCNSHLSDKDNLRYKLVF